MTTLVQSNPWAGYDIARDLFLFSPMIAIIVTMLVVVVVPMIAGRGPRPIAGVVSIGVIAALVLSLRVAGAVGDGGASGLSPEISSDMLIADNLSACFQIVLLVFLGGVTYLWWIGSAETEENAPEFFVLLLGSALGMMLMASTSHLLMIVVAIEAASLPSYAIVGFDKSDRRGAEASLKYMIFGAVSLAIMLYGVSLVYGLVGSLSFAEVARYAVVHIGMDSNGLLLGLALLCVLAGIAFKVSAVPFHFWCPDAFEGAKIEVTTWLSVASKAAGLVLLMRLVMIFSASIEVPIEMSLLRPVAWTIGIMAVVTCTVANFAAYRQTSVKRLLAYSSIAHAGYMMMATAVFLHPSVSNSYAGVAALLVYIVLYVFMNLGAFGVTALVAWDTGNDSLESFMGLARRAPWLAVPMIICLMSLVGLPPLAGFLGKWWILVALGEMGTTLGWFLVISAVVNTLISLYYYLRVVVRMTIRDSKARAVSASIGGIALVNVCALTLLVLFVLAQPLKATAERFSRNLFQTTSVLPQDDARFAATTTVSTDGS